MQWRNLPASLRILHVLKCQWLTRCLTTVKEGMNSIFIAMIFWKKDGLGAVFVGVGPMNENEEAIHDCTMCESHDSKGQVLFVSFGS